MNIFAIAALINVSTSAVLGILVFFASYRARLNQIFLLFAGSISLWSLSYFFWQISTEPEDALFWSHMLMAGAICITPVYFHFVTLFLGIEKRLKVAIELGYLFLVIFSFINWTPLFISSVEFKEGFGLWPSAGPFFSVFLIIWILYAVLPVYFLAKYIPHAESHMRPATILILIGTIIGYAGGTTNYFLWYDIPIPPYGEASASVYIVLVAYATMRHRLFNMKIIASELLIFSLWLFIFVRLLLGESLREQIIEAWLLAVTLCVGVLLIRAIDKEVAQRELIEVQEKELERVNRQQNSLLHFISHEIKGYLTKGQNAFAGIIEGDYGKPTKGIMEISTGALKELRTGVDTVINILEASNFKKGTVTYNKTPFDFREAVLRVAEDLRKNAEGKGLQFEVLAFSIGTYEVLGDSDKIKRHVIRNLIDNAIRYTQTGSIEITVSASTDCVLMSVQDTGVGITPADMSRLFTEGGHGEESIKVNVDSTGYGLYIAKQVVEAHQGSIQAVSEGAGKGSVFTVKIPKIEVMSRTTPVDGASA